MMWSEIRAMAAVNAVGRADYMDISILIGAHHSAVSSLRQWLSRGETPVWGTEKHCGALVGGQMAQRRRGALRLALCAQQQGGAARVDICDETIIGSAAGSLMYKRLYSHAGEQVAALADIMAGHPLRIALVIRDYAGFWSATLAHHIWNGAQVPDEEALDHLVTQPRRWRDVITDVAQAAPNAQVVVWSYEALQHLPHLQCEAMTGVTPQTTDAGEMPVVTPDCAALRDALEARGLGETLGLGKGDGEWQPFAPHQSAALHAQYRNDLAWLRQGADGLADYIEAEHKTPAFPDMTRG